jgi:hypothetical protein
VFRARSEPSGGLAGEVTRLNFDRQFKPFVYLNGRMARTCVPPGRPIGEIPKEKSPALRRDPSCSRFLLSELATALALLVGLLALTVRVLLLLARLLATALLLAGLLTGLLARVLVLLARVLVLVGHRDLPLLNVTSWLNVTEDNNPQARAWFQRVVGFRHGHCEALACRNCGGRKLLKNYLCTSP